MTRLHMVGSHGLFQHARQRADGRLAMVWWIESARRGNRIDAHNF